MAKALDADSQYQKAILAFRNVLQYRPQDSDTRLAYGQCLSKAKRFLEASHEFNKAIRFSPTLWQAHFELAKMYFRVQNWNVASSHAKKIYELNSEHFEGRIIWIYALVEQGQLSKAKDILKGTIEIADLNDFEMLRALAGVSANTHQLEKAVEYYQKALAIKPNSSTVRIRLASVLTQQSKWEQAENNIHMVLEADANNWSVLVCRAELNIAKKDLGQAEIEFNNLIQHFPNSPYPKTRLASVYCASNQKVKATGLIEEVLSRYPENPEALLLRAQLYFEQQRYRLTIAMVERYLKAKPKKVLRAYRMLARTYMALNEIIKAREMKVAFTVTLG